MKNLPLNQYISHASQLVYGCMAIGGEWDFNPLTKDPTQHAFAAVDAALKPVLPCSIMLIYTEWVKQNKHLVKC